MKNLEIPRIFAAGLLIAKYKLFFVQTLNINLYLIFFTIIFLFLFASPPSSASLVGAGKKETKRSPPIDDRPIGGCGYVDRLCYCSFSIGNSTLRVYQFAVIDD